MTTQIDLFGEEREVPTWWMCSCGWFNDDKDARCTKCDKVRP